MSELLSSSNNASFLEPALRANAEKEQCESLNLFSVVVNSIKAFVATTIWIIKSKYIQARRERLNT